MIRELPSPPKPLLLEASLPLDARFYKRAQELINMDTSRWRAKLGLEILGKIPDWPELPDDKQQIVAKRVRSANKALKYLRPFIPEAMREMNVGSPEDSLRLIRAFLTEPELLLESFPCSRRDCLIATSLLAVEYSAGLYKHSRRESDRNKWWNSALYFGTIHDLLIGTQTSTSFFLKFPNECDLDFLSESQLVIAIPGGEESIRRLRTAFLFENYPIRPCGNGFVVEIVLHQKKTKASNF